MEMLSLVIYIAQKKKKQGFTKEKGIGKVVVKVLISQYV